MQTATAVDQDPVALTCGIDENDALVLYYQDAPLLDGEITIQLGELAATSVIIADFVHGGSAFVVNASSIQPDSTLTAWPRAAKAAVLQPVAHDNGSEVIIDAIVHGIGDGAEATARERAIAHPPVVECQLRIRVRKDGDKPTG